MSDRITLTNRELKDIEDSAVRAPSKDGSIAERVVEALVKHMSDTYGIDLGIETENKANARAKREKILLKRDNRGKRGPDGEFDDGFDSF